MKQTSEGEGSWRMTQSLDKPERFTLLIEHPPDKTEYPGRLTEAPKVAFPYGEGFERPEKCPVDIFQRERAGRPLKDFPENACIVPP